VSTTSRCQVVNVLAALGVGFVLGIAVDCVYLGQSSRHTGRNISPLDPIGQWVDRPNGRVLEFNADGTFAHEIPMFDMREGQGSPAGTQRQLRQWRWIDEEWIQMNKLEGVERARVVIDGDVLKLLRADGDVREYRKK
jgi:hypothetical protein